ARQIDDLVIAVGVSHHLAGQVGFQVDCGNMSADDYSTRGIAGGAAQSRNCQLSPEIGSGQKPGQQKQTASSHKTSRRECKLGGWYHRLTCASRSGWIYF